MRARATDAPDHPNPRLTVRLFSVRAQTAAAAALFDRRGRDAAGRCRRSPSSSCCRGPRRWLRRGGSRIVAVCFPVARCRPSGMRMAMAGVPRCSCFTSAVVCVGAVVLASASTVAKGDVIGTLVGPYKSSRC